MDGINSSRPDLFQTTNSLFPSRDENLQDIVPKREGIGAFLQN